MNKLKVVVLASLVALLAITGCQNPINPGQGGTLTVSMNDAVSRSILPGISMNPASYDLTGTGPNGASFSQTVSSGSSATIADLAFGEWMVTATAKNAAGTAIGQGSGTVTVLSNASVSLAITVRPYDGFGTLSLNVSWPAAQVQTAQITSTLTPASGSARDLSFTVNGSAGTASYNASDVATGYHTLILKLLDNGHLAIGAVEVVRIVKDQTTSGTLTFANVNQATGTLEINLTPEMGDPLEVSISGSAATKPANQSLSLSAAVNNYSDNVTYVWYVNGDAVATDASYSFDNTWAQGYYRIDVTAFSADGKRAGSGSSSIQVTEAGDSIPTTPLTYQISGIQPSIFDVSNDGSVTMAQVLNGNIIVSTLNGDGSIQKAPFIVNSFDPDIYSIAGVDLARAKESGISALTWWIYNHEWPTDGYDWQTWVAFIGPDGNLLNTPHLLDPHGQPGINRYASVQISDNGISAFIYEGFNQSAYRLVIYNPDGSLRAATDVGKGLLTNGALGRAIGMNKKTGEVIVAGEAMGNPARKYYQRFSSNATPIDQSMVYVPQLDMIQGPWSISFFIEYNDEGNVVFLSNLDYPSGVRKAVFFSNSMQVIGESPLYGNGYSGNRILLAPNGDFILPVHDTVAANGVQQRYTKNGSFIASSNSLINCIDDLGNMYRFNGSTIVRTPFSF